MDLPIHIDTISMGLPIVYFKGAQVEFSKLRCTCFSVPEGCLNLANSADSDEMQQYAAFHLGLHCLPKYLYRGFPVYERLNSHVPCLKVNSMLKILRFYRLWLVVETNT